MWRQMRHLSDKDLLLWIDREVGEHSAAEIELHLSECDLCRLRSADLEHSMASFVDVYKSQLREGSPPPEVRAFLKARIGERASSRADAAGWLVGGVAVTVMVLVSGAVLGSRTDSRDLYMPSIPNVRLTPGVINPVTVREVCTGNLPINDPAVPDPLKREVLREYGLKNVAADAYQMDYLVTPQLGGAVNLRNLWPQPALKTRWNAHAKDELEDRLHALVCSGQLDLTTAQHELSEDWVGAYKKYFGTKEPPTVSLLGPPHLKGTRMIRCSVASSTAFREYGIG